MLDGTDSQQKIIQVADIFASAVDDEMVMANLQTGKYYGLDVVSTTIWQLLKEPRTLGEVCNLLMRQFAVDEATCRQDVAEFIEALLAAKLVQLVGM